MVKLFSLPTFSSSIVGYERTERNGWFGQWEAGNLDGLSERNRSERESVAKTSVSSLIDVSKKKENEDKARGWRQISGHKSVWLAINEWWWVLNDGRRLLLS